MDIIKFSIVTESNCLIGNQTTPFSTGGIDQSTMVDCEEFPMISASSFKGALRNIYRENENDFEDTQKYIQVVLEEVMARYDQLLTEPDAGNEVNKARMEQIQNTVKKIKEKMAQGRAEYIFGIEGVNNAPKLYFFDIKVKVKSRIRAQDCFIIDMKNNIEEKNGQLTSNPRTYKCIKPGTEFEGRIGFNECGFKSPRLNELKEKMLKEVQKALLYFNGGFYGIGNSKSRGYGNITVSIEE